MKKVVKNNQRIRWIVGLLAITGISVLIVQGVPYRTVDKLNDLPNFTSVQEPITATTLDITKQPYIGDPEAPIQVIEFGDFKCVACKVFATSLKERLIQEYVETGKIKFIYVNYAFLDRDSYMAAAAGEALLRQSNALFWDFHDKLYANQGKANEIWATKDYLLRFVQEHLEDVDMERFEQDLRSDAFMFDVKEDFKLAGALGVNGTPQFFVNDKLHRISSYENLANAIDEAYEYEVMKR